MSAFGDRRTALARVRHLGSAKEGVAHWWAQRVTALPGQRVARRAVGHGQHELGAAVPRRRQAGRAPVGPGGHAADHLRAVGILAPGQVGQ